MGAGGGGVAGGLLGAPGANPSGGLLGALADGLVGPPPTASSAAKAAGYPTAPPARPPGPIGIQLTERQPWTAEEEQLLMTMAAQQDAVGQKRDWVTICAALGTARSKHSAECKYRKIMGIDVDTRVHR